MRSIGAIALGTSDAWLSGRRSRRILCYAELSDARGIQDLISRAAVHANSIKMMSSRYIQEICWGGGRCQHVAIPKW